MEEINHEPVDNIKVRELCRKDARLSDSVLLGVSWEEEQGVQMRRKSPKTSRKKKVPFLAATCLEYFLASLLVFLAALKASPDM